MTGGMAYEALNHGGQDPAKLIVILNDNNMSIDPPTGALSSTLSRVVTSDPYQDFRSVAKRLPPSCPRPENVMRGGFFRRTWQGGDGATAAPCLKR